MRKNFKSMRFAICINTDDPDLVTPRMIYRVMSDESAAKSKYIRVIDNEGEDYLYPANYFMPMVLPDSIEKALRHIPQRTGSKTEQKRAPISAIRRKVKPSAA